MAFGPMEYVVLEFEVNQFRGEIVPALRDVVSRGVIRIDDLVLVKKDRDGDVTVSELKDLGKDAATWEPLLGDLKELFSHDDIEQLTKNLKPNSTAALVLFEHTWAANLRDAIIRAKGRLIADNFVPPEVVEEALPKRKRAAAG